ncbi:MAG: hypothetical protein GWP08_18600 [Nitrospiraceae bacterium]|nr:hypothetical protein [Nitrospiraceae bacterium]
MKLIAWIRTNRIGSKCEDKVDIEDDELDDLGESQAEAVLDGIACEAIWNVAEWGWRLEDDDGNEMSTADARAVAEAKAKEDAR